jgi:uncharacterized membrane protein
MEKNILVGCLVGLTIFISIHVGKSDAFTKPQKIGIICCLVFPPLQWILFFLVLAYNKYKLNNTSDAKERKQNIVNIQKLESIKYNLVELMEKGIISEEEFNSKVEKIESQKTDYDIKNSTEFKQLKDLFDSGILTKDEFENKVKLITEFSEKEIDKHAVESILKLANESYLKNNKNY